LQIVHTQNLKLDSLKNLLVSAKDDSTKLLRLSELFNEYLWSYPDSSLPYVQQAILLGKQMKSNVALLRAYNEYGLFYIIIGDYPQALHYIQESLKLAEKSGDFLAIASAYDLMEIVYQDEGNYEQALSYEKMAKSVMESHWTPSFSKFKNLDTVAVYLPVLNGFAQIYEKLNQLDSALKYTQIVDEAYEKLYGKNWAAASYELGNIYSKKGDYSTAIKYYHSGIALSAADNNNKDLMDNYNGIANTFKKANEFDSSIFYANKVIELSKSAHYSIAKLNALNLLSETYKSTRNIDSVAKYLQLTISTKDSLFSLQKILQIQSLTFEEQLREQERAQQSQQLQNEIKFYSLLAALIVFLIIAFLLYRNNLQKEQAYSLLQKQKQETDIQKAKVEQTLEELKAAQTQLIRREKMASLGELTAGIAHEIQNPLNFVNNFSEVSVELLNELKEGPIQKLPETDKKEVEEMLEDIIQNLGKIEYHGKRAGSIVKGMLQHSRTGTGQKELTDINSMVDECLRLSYHGLRAKDKTFNVALQTDFDENVGKIYIISQDIGRVFLNLFTNAFYSVSQKKKQLTNKLTTEKADYEPTVYVSTRKISSPPGTEYVEIHVRDNGTGISQKIMDKIFQPFFTTKPIGQGTGLGLSLSYDIITKSHGGTIKVETIEGECAKFIIVLPVKEKTEQ
jgi:two-component system NtrC family sensor kinase